MTVDLLEVCSEFLGFGSKLGRQLTCSEIEHTHKNRIGGFIYMEFEGRGRGSSYSEWYTTSTVIFFLISGNVGMTDW